MYRKIQEELKKNNVQLVCVSKTRSNHEILKIYDQGQRVFGENRVQELVTKQESLPKDIEWHLIGSLQKNKVKYIAAFVEMIHSVDSLELAKKIDQEAEKNQRTINVLLQFKIATEFSKQGLAFDESRKTIEAITGLKNIRICGVMGMASFTDNKTQVEQEFKRLKSIYTELKTTFKTEDFNTISMGMSGDYPLAIDCGSTMVRIGSLIFGPRT